MTRFARGASVGGATFEPFAGRHSALVRGSSITRASCSEIVERRAKWPSFPTVILDFKLRKNSVPSRGGQPLL
jgi:hypothetical protein